MDVAEATQTWRSILSETSNCSDEDVKTALGIGKDYFLKRNENLMLLM